MATALTPILTPNASDQPIRPGDLLETLAKALGLSAALLPVAGIVARYAAFASGVRVADPTELAVSAPLSLLVVSGIFSVIPVVVLIALFALGWLGRPTKTASPATVPASPPAARSTLIFELVILVIRLLIWISFTIYLIAIAPNWPTGALSAALGVVAWWLLGRRIRNAGRSALIHAWPGVGLVLLVGAVVWGLGGSLSGVDVHDFTFRSELHALASDGRYAQLGESGGAIYLQDCSNPARILAVGENEIIASRLEPATATPQVNVSLVDVLTKGRHAAFGYQSPC